VRGREVRQGWEGALPPPQAQLGWVKHQVPEAGREWYRRGRGLPNRFEGRWCASPMHRMRGWGLEGQGLRRTEEERLKQPMGESPPVKSRNRNKEGGCPNSQTENILTKAPAGEKGNPEPTYER
jgi:hypothetical protein